MYLQNRSYQLKACTDLVILLTYDTEMWVQLTSTITFTPINCFKVQYVAPHFKLKLLESTRLTLKLLQKTNNYTIQSRAYIHYLQVKAGTISNAYSIIVILLYIHSQSSYSKPASHIILKYLTQYYKILEMH